MERILQEGVLMKQYLYQSEMGPLYLTATPQGLSGLFWEKRPITLEKSADEFFKRVMAELEEYFNGLRVTFSIPLDLQGTDFQKKVWSELMKIPYGETRSYKEVAKKLNIENASRAVGTANGRNPICIIVPCHRVINSNGGLGGYSGGIDKKILLLENELR
jgi:methylated-DNA-[protein]-cysteine S-methyltransferase